MELFFWSQVSSAKHRVAMSSYLNGQWNKSHCFVGLLISKGFSSDDCISLLIQNNEHSPLQIVPWSNQDFLASFFVQHYLLCSGNHGSSTISRERGKGFSWGFGIFDAKGITRKLVLSFMLRFWPSFCLKSWRLIFQIDILLMVQKSGKLTSWGW